MRGACLLSRRSEDVSIFFGRASVHCEGLLDYWIDYELPEEVCWTVWWPKPAVETLHSTLSSLSYLFVLPLPFCEFTKHTTALHYRYDMQIYCTFFSFRKSTFSGATREWDALYFWLFSNDFLITSRYIVTILEKMICILCHKLCKFLKDVAYFQAVILKSSQSDPLWLWQTRGQQHGKALDVTAGAGRGRKCHALWNAPSFYCTQDITSKHLRKNRSVMTAVPFMTSDVKALKHIWS
jgi:hypothetical protein